MSVLNMIRRGTENIPPRVLVYGREGVGKSTFAAGTPNPVFVLTEDGISQISTTSFPLCRDVGDVRRYLQTLIDGEHDFRTVVIDSLDWLENLVFAEVVRAENKPNIRDISDFEFGKGYSKAGKVFREILGMLQRLRMERRMIVILIAHAKDGEFSDPDTAKVRRFAPKLQKTSMAVICEWVDLILQAKLTQAGERLLRSNGSLSCVAKTRYRIPATVPMRWKALYVEISKRPEPKRPETQQKNEPIENVENETSEETTENTNEKENKDGEPARI